MLTIRTRLTALALWIAVAMAGAVGSAGAADPKGSHHMQPPLRSVFMDEPTGDCHRLHRSAMKAHGGAMDHAAMMRTHAMHSDMPMHHRMMARHHAMMQMCAQHHGRRGGMQMSAEMMARHMAMMGARATGPMPKGPRPGAKGMGKPAMMKMPAAHTGASCGTYMYRKAGHCVDARSKT